MTTAIGKHSTTKVIRCDAACRSTFQDRVYGTRKRVHNKTMGDSNKRWRCTVCGKVRGTGRAPYKKEDES